MTSKINWAHEWIDRSFSFYYDGQFKDPLNFRQTNYFELINPSNEEHIANIPIASQKDVDAAVLSAKRAQPLWENSSRATKQKTLMKMGEILREHAEELATLETLNNGKLYRESLNDDLPESSAIFDYYAGWTDKIYDHHIPVDSDRFNFTRREAVGVCGLIVPWNFPLLMACWKIAPALACGNSVVVKASEWTPLSLIRAFELWHEKLELPSGLVNLILGDAKTGQHLANSHSINKIAFTGSTATGRKIVESAASSNLKSVNLELGGKSPNILFEDTENFERAVERQYQAIFSHKAEKCSEPTLFFVHQTLYQAALEKLELLAKNTVLDDPFSASSTQGPQAHRAHFEKVKNYIQNGVNSEAKLLCGGLPKEEQKGYFIPPTIFYDVKMEMEIAREEIFGPVLCVIPFDDEESVVTMANSTSYGLAAGFYTQDYKRIHRVSAKLNAGMVFVNHYGQYDFSSPFGGFKESGWGKEMSHLSLDAYTKLKSVWVQL